MHPAYVLHIAMNLYLSWDVGKKKVQFFHKKLIGKIYYFERNLFLRYVVLDKNFLLSKYPL